MKALLFLRVHIIVIKVTYFDGKIVMLPVWKSESNRESFAY